MAPAILLERDGGNWFIRVPRLGSVDARLRVVAAEAGGDLPDVSGKVHAEGDGVRFVPDFPFEPGVRFRAILERGGGEAEVADLTVPREAAGLPPEVAQVFPSGDLLPENLLRFYVRFSQPMRRGRAADNIAILGPDGRPAADVLYRPPVELWDKSMTCLTVLLDPGRLKRGVGPNRVLGPPLRAGLRYTLVVGEGIAGADGLGLARAFRKSFEVTEAVREAIEIGRWRVQAPVAGGRGPVELDFPRALDWAELRDGILVACEDGRRLGGRIDVGPDERSWAFTPHAPWRTGVYRLSISAELEDVCGNTLDAPFDRSLKSAGQTDRAMRAGSLSFQVNATVSQARTASPPAPAASPARRSRRDSSRAAGPPA
jgi:hypothetical protein